MSLPGITSQAMNPEAMSAAASLVMRDYGYTGYVLRLEASGGVQGRQVFRVAHFDGSEFRVMSDRWGNAWRLPDVDDLCEAVRQFNRSRAEVDA